MMVMLYWFMMKVAELSATAVLFPVADMLQNTLHQMQFATAKYGKRFPAITMSASEPSLQLTIFLTLGLLFSALTEILMVINMQLITQALPFRLELKPVMI